MPNWLVEEVFHKHEPHKIQYLQSLQAGDPCLEKGRIALLRVYEIHLSVYVLPKALFTFSPWLFYSIQIVALLFEIDLGNHKITLKFSLDENSKGQNRINFQVGSVPSTSCLGMCSIPLTILVDFHRTFSRFVNNCLVQSSPKQDLIFQISPC